MTTQNHPYEILLRFKDGKLTGAHYIEVTRYLDDEGELITEKTGQAQPIPTELSETILGAVNTAALGRITELEAELKTAKEGPKPEKNTIRAWQAKAVLALSGLLEPAQAVIAALQEPQRTIVTSAWDNNADFSRTSPTILALAEALGLTDEQLDAMFQQAASLSV